MKNVGLKKSALMKLTKAELIDRLLDAKAEVIEIREQYQVKCFICGKWKSADKTQFASIDNAICWDCEEYQE